MKLKGIHAHRLKDSSNRHEILFAKAWKSLNQADPKFLATLLDPDGSKNPPEPSDRDYEVASTILQWLGSSSGRNFLDNVERAGRGLVKV